MDTKYQEIDLIEVQTVASFLFIITIIISIFLNLNEKYKLECGRGYIDDDLSYNILLGNRIVIFIILIVYFYISYENKKLDMINKKNLKADDLELIVSILSIIGGLIILYSVYKYGRNSAAIFENPTN